jgi:hypothetical protein
MSRRTPLFVEYARVVGLPLSPAQCAFASVCFDGARELPEELLTVGAELFPYVLATIPKSACTTVALVAGARSGKTRMGSSRLLHAGLTADLTSLAPGEHAFGVIVAPDLKLGRQAFRFVLSDIEAGALRPFGAMVVGQTADSVTIRRSDGRIIIIECLAATRGGSALRGRALFAVLGDEVCFLRDSDSVVNDAEIYAAVTPRLLPGAQCMLFSTPWIRSGLLFNLLEQNRTNPTTAIAVHAPTLLFRGDDATVTAMVRRERMRDPRNAAREFDAVFLDSAESAFDVDELRSLVTPGVAFRPWQEGISYGLVYDLGLRNDATAAIVFHREMRTAPNGQPLDVLVIDAVLHLQPSKGQRLELEPVMQRLIELARRYRIRVVHGDRHLSDGAKPLFQRASIQLVELGMTVKEQAQRAELLMSRITSRAIALVDHPALIAELRKVQLKRRPGGGFVVEAVGSGHDDLADCVLGMNDAVFSKLAPTFADGRGGTLKKTPLKHWWNEAGLTVSGGDYYREAPDGSIWPADMPPSDRRFLANAREQIRNGCWTRTVEAFVDGLGLRAVPAVAEFLDCPELAPPELRLPK